MNYFTTPTAKETAFTVSQLNRQIQQLLEASLPWILVEGEVSNFARPGSGHWYFSLKDDKAQIRCTMFKNRNSAVRFQPKEGDKVRLRAKVTFYGPRGDCQLSVETMEAAGEGALQQAFERLKNQLQLEGLFDAKHKQTLPSMPERVALITSPTGAVIRDMISAFKRRFPLTELTLFPSLVQGSSAANNLISQLKRADSSGYFDAIIIGRGGGSLEDLWGFNDEALARAIFNAQTPIVSAVGHETDFTIADFVADVRAATPTAAAELLSPDKHRLLVTLQQQERQLSRMIGTCLNQYQQRLDFLTQRIRHPQERIAQQQSRLDQLNSRLGQIIQQKIQQPQTTLNHLQQRLTTASLMTPLRAHQTQIQQLELRLAQALKQQVTNKQTAFANLMEKLHLVSPLQTLSRGYAIASKQQQVVSRIEQVSEGDSLSIRVRDGAIDCVVQATKTIKDTPL